MTCEFHEGSKRAGGGRERSELELCSNKFVALIMTVTMASEGSGERLWAAEDIREVMTVRNRAI